jgi:hypothetical protein
MSDVASFGRQRGHGFWRELCGLAQGWRGFLLVG